jgi:hypothetical protein
MKSKSRVQRRIELIKEMTDPIKALHELADLTFEIGEEACEERKEIRMLTEKNRLALIGNGNPETSLVGRLLSVENKVDLFACDIREIKELLIGGVSQRELSLKARMDKFEDYVARSEKLQWFTLTAIVSYVIYQVLTSIF